MDNLNTKQSHRFVGIDLGNTNTKLSMLDDSGRPKVIPNPQGDTVIPSVVYVGESEMLFGKEAESMATIDPDRVFRNFKPDVGFNVVYPLPDGGSITPDELQTYLLKYAKECVKEYTGDPNACDEAVFTVPVEYKQPQRQSVEHSAKESGIKVIKLLNEPTAAMLSYESLSNVNDLVGIVLDAGGFSFDADVISVKEGTYDVLSSYGIDAGGRDVDESILHYVLEAIQKSHGIIVTAVSHPIEYYALQTEAERVKQFLTVGDKTQFRAFVEGHSIQVDITSGALSGLIEGYRDKISKAIREAMSRIDLKAEQIGFVMPVGGSSRLGVFKALIEEKFGSRKILRSSVDCDLAVSFGAAKEAVRVKSNQGLTIVSPRMQMIPVPNYKVTDVMPFDVGIAACESINSEARCSAILEKNLPIPCSASKPFGSLSADQEEFSIRVLQGEEGQSEKDCVLVGQALLNLPPRSPGIESLIVQLDYDESGIIRTKVTDRVCGRVEDITIDYFKNGGRK